MSQYRSYLFLFYTYGGLISPSTDSVYDNYVEQNLKDKDGSYVVCNLMTLEQYPVHNAYVCLWYLSIPNVTFLAPLEAEPFPSP
jgi:hypothetical protein